MAVLLAAGQVPGYRVPRPLEEVAARREARATSPLVALDVQELASLWDFEDPEQVVASLSAAAEDPRTPPWVAGYARWTLGHALLQLGRTEEARQAFGSLGFVQDWIVVGPFDNDNESGFEREDPPEADLAGALDLDATYQGKLRQVGWRDYPADGDLDGATSLGSILDPAESSCAYLATTVEAARAERAALRLGGDGALRAWVNGVQVFEDSGLRRAVPDRSAAGVQLRRGRNRLFVKSCVVSGPWDLYVRLTAPDGRPLRGLRVVSRREAVAARPPRGAEPFEVPSLWSWFNDQAAAEGAPAEAHADLARFLARFGGDDPDEHRARDEAQAAVDAEATGDHLLLLAQVHPDRNHRIEALEQALEAEPRREDLLLALAGERMEGPHPEDALALVSRASAAAPESVYPVVARADVLDGLGYSLTARGLVLPASERHPSGHLTSVLRGLAGRAGRSADEVALMERYFETHRASTGLRLELAQRQAARHEHDEAAAIIRGGLELAPLSAALRLALAETLEAAGDPAGAEAALRQVLEQRPEDAAIHDVLAHFLDRQGRDEDAVVAARRSLALRPENPDLREWLEVVEAEDRFEAPYVEEAATFLARRGRVTDHDVHTLVDLRVRQVHQSGQSSEFRQVAYEAVTLEGARGVGRFQVAYAPDRQRLRIERARVHRPDGSTREAVSRRERDVYDPSVRMYYDIRVADVVFGDLQPGDVVEVRYRLDDVAGANELGNYFGEVAFLQSSNPVARSAYVLLAPRDRQLYFAEPALASVDHRVREEGEVVEHFFEALDVPAVAVESGMPPIGELAARVHVSTYSSWEELGRWYWSLARDQLELDASQRRRVDELVAGAPDDLAKVRAIHRHVVTTVRYVALEFGVHRYKPYRVSDIERRGFGDCKDQASLMVAMLRHAGVEAQLALVRTSSLGRIPTEPASLEVFNHAIVYVPSLGIHIDPTAERVAVGDLPGVDQGVMALRVGEGSVTFEQTPLLPAERQGRRLVLDVALDGEGRARGTLEMDTNGWVAGATRASLDDPASRVSTLEGLYSRYLRGISVSNVRTSDLTALDTLSSVTADVEVPGLGRREGGDLTFPVSIAPPLTSLVSLPERRHDLVLGPPYRWQEELTIRLPAGRAPAAIPGPVEVSSELATFRLAAERSGDGAVVVRSTLDWRAERVTPEGYPELRRFVEQVTAARTARIRLVSR